MTSTTLPPIGHHSATIEVSRHTATRRYVAPMGTAITAHDIAAELRRHLSDRVTYLPDRKLHALLYLLQGAWLVTHDEPLFPESITATDVGVQVAGVGSGPGADLNDQQFAHVGVVGARYAGLSAMDLEALIRGQQPWADTETSSVIGIDLIRRQFRGQEEIPEGTLHGIPLSVRAKLHRPYDPDRPRPSNPDSPEEIEAFIAEVQARM